MRERQRARGWYLASVRRTSLFVVAVLLSACGPSRIDPPAVPSGCVSCGVADAGGELPPEGGVSIASFNVKLFFDPVCDSGACGSTDFEKVPTQAEFDARAQQIADAIARLGADVVSLQEIENQAALDAITSRLPEFPYSVLGEIGYAGSVDVAVVSRHRIVEVVRHRDQLLYRPDGSETRFTREFLEVHVDISGKLAVVFAAHFRSKVNDDAGRRWAEAVAAHDIAAGVAQQLAPPLVIIGGDLNDVPGSPPLDALESDGALFRTSSDQPQDQIGTYTYYGVSQPIDHLLVATGSKGQLVPHSFTVLRDGKGYGGSDHAAIRATFVLPP